MVRFNSLTGVTLSYIPCNLSLHSKPPEILLQVLVHLIGSRMDTISRAMRFIQYFATELKVFGNH
jgi:hypothetical protein